MADGYRLGMSAVEAMELVKRLAAEEAVDLVRMVDDWTAGLVDKRIPQGGTYRLVLYWLSSRLRGSSLNWTEAEHPEAEGFRGSDPADG